MALSAGTRLGPYEILSPLGAGGMGEVYRAKDTRLDRTVAIKVLPEHLSNPQLRERFEREAKAISSLSHPHICPLYDVGHQDGVDFLVMEYLEGETLASRLKKGPLALDQALRYAIQITDALDTAHKHAVIHRDLKPGNIMLTKSGAKLLDFGLAKVRAAEAAAGMTALPTQTTPLTGEGTILGTLQYMAPEQLEGAEADARTDIFALGAVIYEMATGRKAFAGKSQASVISAIMTAEPPPISTLQTMAPPPLDHVVQTCLAKEPDMRWQTAHDVLVELKWIGDAGSQVGIPKPVVAQRKRRELVSWAVTAVVSLAFLILAFVHFRERPHELRPIRFSISPPEKVILADLEEAGPALISPDGSRLAFVGVADAVKSQLWVRPLEAAVAQPLAGTAGATYPFWSPNSRDLAFFADGKLKKVSAEGGPPETLCDAPNGRGGSWAASKEGGPGIIVFAPDVYAGLSRVSAAGGEPVQVTTRDSSHQEVSHRQPEFFPDGRHFTYVALSDRTENHGIFIGDIQAKPDPKNVRRLMGGVGHVSYAPPGYLLFLRDNNLIAQAFDARRLEFSGEPFVLADHVAAGVNRGTVDFSVSTNGVLAWRTQSGATRQLAWFDRSGKQIQGLDARERYFYGNMSPDGKRVAVNRSDPVQPGIFNIWLLDLIRGSASRFTFGTGAQTFPVWSPDGRRIVFGLDRAPDYGLYWKDSSGAGNEELLLKTDRLSVPSDWSRDGRFILFAQFEPKGPKYKIWVLPLIGDRKPVPVLRTEFIEGWGHFSPDSHWIAYCSDESGRFEVYVRSFTEGGAAVTAGKWQISTAGGMFSSWRRDGKELFFTTSDGKLMAVPVKAGSTFEAGIPVALFDTHDGSIDSTFDVTRDGQRFLINRSFEGGADRPVNICLNWLAGMKK
jgi:serine/threonine protein kinase/Tol biopolymer transport system component